MRALLILAIASCNACGVDDTLDKPIRLCNIEGNLEQREACACRHLEPGACYALTLDEVIVCMPDPDPSHSITEFPPDAVFCEVTP